MPAATRVAASPSYLTTVTEAFATCGVLPISASGIFSHSVRKGGAQIARKLPRLAVPRLVKGEVSLP